MVWFMQLRMVSTRSEKPICAPSRLSEDFSTLLLKSVPNVHLTDDGRSWKGSASRHLAVISFTQHSIICPAKVDPTTLVLQSDTPKSTPSLQYSG